jgi:hypothetical protein
MTTTSQTAHASGSGRKLGHGYSLAIHTGGGTHLTLVYFNNCKRGYEQDMVKQMASDYFQSRNLTTVDFTLGDSYNERSVRVKGQVIESIISDLTHKIFTSFDIDQNQVPHIDLRGNTSTAVIQTQKVSLVNNFVY